MFNDRMQNEEAYKVKRGNLFLSEQHCHTSIIYERNQEIKSEMSAFLQEREGERDREGDTGSILPTIWRKVQMRQ
jgi:hypothetical protein